MIKSVKKVHAVFTNVANEENKFKGMYLLTRLINQVSSLRKVLAAYW